MHFDFVTLFGCLTFDVQIWTSAEEGEFLCNHLKGVCVGFEWHLVV